MVGVSIFILFSPIFWVLSSQKDFFTHHLIAEALQNGTGVPAPHIEYELLLLLLQAVGVSWQFAGYLIAMAMEVWSGILIYKLVADREQVSGKGPLLITLGLLLASPITLITLFSHNLYWGYVAITTYHNPTILLLRPLALLSMILLLQYVDGERVRKMGLLVVLTFATFAKPSFTIALLPALALFSLINWKYLREKKMLSLIVVASAVLVLLLLAQLFIAYSSSSSSSSIAFLPMYYFQRRFSWLRILLSMAYPLSVLFTFREAYTDRALQLNWLLFFFGLMFSLLFIETGDRQSHGNFLWTGQITLFLLFVFSMKFDYQSYQHPNLERWKTGRSLRRSIFILHVICGLLWYYSEINNFNWY